MPRIRVNGVELHYEWHGPEDAPVVVLSNGVLANTAGWFNQTPVLSKGFRVLLYDCRGQGRSEHPAGPYSMEMHADDLAELLTALEVEKAHIGGISYGGEISLLFAAKYPDRTKSVIAMSAVSEVLPLLRAQIELWTAAAQAHDPLLFFRATVTHNFSAAFIASNQAFLESSISRFAALDIDAVPPGCREAVRGEIVRRPDHRPAREQIVPRERRRVRVIAAEPACSTTWLSIARTEAK